ncbi:HD domain-containing protein [Clostridium sp. PL3]|uniref:HD domain-containing protein n=1 Tax=Clostridium thailandense TaxID=2794346 RepID=A0A949U5K8_9CLOT|nr:HD domain-containing phosphohydrolase [Clostridium thailandense]MBV7276884.1 HD domain-containing protein [Clostridium thailandense]
MYEFLFVIYTVGLVFAIICLIATYAQKPSKQQNIMFMISIYALIISMGYWFSIQSKSLEASIIAYKIIYFGASSITYIFFLFFISFYDLKNPKWIKCFFVIVCSVLTFSTLFMDKIKVFYTSYELTFVNNIPVLIKKYGFMHTVYVFMNYTLLISMSVIVIYQAKKYKHRSKMLLEDILLLSLPSIPLMQYGVSKLFPIKMDLNSIGILISEILLLVLIYKMKIYDINDTAREFIINSIADAVVVIDKDKIYKGANKKAKELFLELDKALPNVPLEDISKYLFKVLNTEKLTKIKYDNREYETSVEKIVKGNELQGFVILHTDITESEESKRLLEDYQKNLEIEVAEKTAKLVSIQEQIIISFANIIESRDLITGEHVWRTEMYVKKITEELIKSGYYSGEVNKNFKNYLYAVSALHDIGKIAVPDSILNKPGKLNDEEYAIMKTHTEKGGEILKKAFIMIEDENYLNMAYDIAVYHHEKWSGQGYPKGLKGYEIPLCARIMAIADVFDALISTRAYKAAYSFEESLSIIREEKGKSFDPILVDLFLKVSPEIEKLAAEIKLGMH